jgi:predicted nucleic acid-binding protein
MNTDLHVMRTEFNSKGDALAAVLAETRRQQLLDAKTARRIERRLGVRIEPICAVWSWRDKRTLRLQ